MTTIQERVRSGRRIDGIAAVLLPFKDLGEIDFAGLAGLIERIYIAGLLPAVNMDTGYVNLLSQEQRHQVLEFAGRCASGRPFIAGAFIEDQIGNLASAYLKEIERVQYFGGTPILFQCSGMKGMLDWQIIEVYRAVAAGCERFLAFELGRMFAPFGQIYSLEVVKALMEIPQIVGMKHSSLLRGPEWERLELRDRVRPDFKIYTGNDLAIDMVMYGSDYLLGLAVLAPDLFARRDQCWLNNDPGFYEINDLLQYLGRFAFRLPITAYKHSAAQFLKLRGWIRSDSPHPKGEQRPQNDLQVLIGILDEMEKIYRSSIF